MTESVMASMVVYAGMADSTMARDQEMLVVLSDDEGAIELLADALLWSRRPETSVSCSSRMLIVSPTRGRSCKLTRWFWALTAEPVTASATIIPQRTNIRIRTDRWPVRSEPASWPGAALAAQRSDGAEPGRTSAHPTGARAL